jgi:hypothetical protein
MEQFVEVRRGFVRIPERAITVQKQRSLATNSSMPHGVSRSHNEDAIPRKAKQALEQRKRSLEERKNFL